MERQVEAKPWQAVEDNFALVLHWQFKRVKQVREWSVEETESGSLHNDDDDEIMEDDVMENEMSGDRLDESSVILRQEMDE